MLLWAGVHSSLGRIHCLAIACRRHLLLYKIFRLLTGIVCWISCSMIDTAIWMLHDRTRILEMLLWLWHLRIRGQRLGLLLQVRWLQRIIIWQALNEWVCNNCLLLLWIIGSSICRILRILIAHLRITTRSSRRCSILVLYILRIIFKVFSPCMLISWNIRSVFADVCPTNIVIIPPHCHCACASLAVVPSHALLSLYEHALPSKHDNFILREGIDVSFQGQCRWLVEHEEEPISLVSLLWLWLVMGRRRWMWHELDVINIAKWAEELLHFGRSCLEIDVGNEKFVGVVQWGEWDVRGHGACGMRCASSFSSVGKKEGTGNRFSVFCLGVLVTWSYHLLQDDVRRSSYTDATDNFFNELLPPHPTSPYCLVSIRGQSRWWRYDHQAPKRTMNRSTERVDF